MAGSQQVQFALSAETRLGQMIYALGDAKELGLWQLAGAVPLATDKHTYPIWSSKPVSISGPFPKTVEYKFVKVWDGRLQQWESFSGNHSLVISSSTPSIVNISDSWGHKSAPVEIGSVANLAPEVPDLPVVLSDDEFIARVEELNLTHRSWKRKLEVVHSLLETESLSYANMGVVAGYCHFIKSGLVKCEEEGGHYRPNNHAELSRAITEILEKLRTDNNALLIRQVLATLPSYQPAFTASVPLTRIRDIAHRNDIPHDLKTEIKTTLQNKLHRCAGPEDLVTCEAILQKVSTMEVSAEFLREFRLFHTELREFFNATGLDDRLHALAGSHPTLRGAIDSFTAAKSQRTAVREVCLTDLRKELSAIKSPQPHEAQSLLLADIELAAFAFSCFSERINSIGGEDLSEGKYAEALRLIHLLLVNLEISGFEAEECVALEHEFALHSHFPRAEADLLRLKATCERTLRMTSEYSDQVSAIQPKVDELGRVLQLDRRAVAVFSEGLIRSQLPFQLSKLASSVLKLVRRTGGFSPWLPIRPGKCQGTVLYARQLANLVFREPTILVLQQAEGDEEVPPNLVGLIISHDLPQLSHLAVRLRQGKVTSAACESQEEVSRLQRVSGFGELTVSGGEVRLTETLKREFRGEEPPSQVVVSAADVTFARVIPAERAEQQSCGAKGYMAGKLESLARSITGFRTPKSMCIPFGVYHKFVPLLPNESREAALDYIDRQVAALSTDLNSLSTAISGHFRTGPLIFRSSANVEDTASVSGAGLYDSIPNVPADDAAEISAAITGVWKSIATVRAWNSREYNRLPHTSALMGVLVQELLTPDFSFVVHTHSPFSGADKVYVEMALGLGETLASGEQRGSPYRALLDKATAEVKLLAVASYSFALVPTPQGISARRTDYSTEDIPAIVQFAGRIGQIGLELERALQASQDIEGVILNSEIWIVQSRPQV